MVRWSRLGFEIAGLCVRYSICYTALPRRHRKQAISCKHFRPVPAEVSGLSYGCLSKSHQSQRESLGNRGQGWRFHRIGEPLGQIALGEEVQPQHRDQIGEAPDPNTLAEPVM